MADLSAQVEAFLRNALSAKKLEDRLIKQALRDLRTTLAAVERAVGSSGALAVGPGRERIIASIVAAVGRSVQDSFGVPQLAAMQNALAPFVERQLDFARRMVTMAGGELASDGAVQVTQAQVNRLVNDAVVGGKTLSTQLTATLPAAVADRVERYIRLGLSDLGGEVFRTYEDAVVRVTENNVEAIIRTGVQEVGNAAQQAIYEFEADPAWMGPEGLVWTAVLDSAVCPICLKLDGKRFPTDYRKVSPHMQCVLGDTPIEGGILAAGMRSVYSGKVVTIRTHGDRLLSVTENHPVLTSNGWKPAKSLQEGDQLVCRVAEPKATVNPDLNQGPVAAEQLFALLGKQATVQRSGVPATAMDFHGDGAGLHGNVDIAGVNWELLLHSKAMCAEHVRHALFVVADAGLQPVEGLSTLDALILAMHATASGFVGASDLATTLLGGHLAPLEGLRLALRARRDPRFDEPGANGVSGNAELLRNLVFAHAGAVHADNLAAVQDKAVGAELYAKPQQAVADAFAANAKQLGDLVNAQSAQVELDDVIGINIDTRSHVPVYDFSTLSGAYFAGGILTHNCRCYLLPWKWRSEDMTDPSGNKVPPKRPADGDGAEQALSFKVAAKQWVSDNPATAQAIFGKKLGQRLVDGEIGFDKAVKLWSAPKTPPAT
jgi:hypothetical protein